MYLQQPVFVVNNCNLNNVQYITDGDYNPANYWTSDCNDDHFDIPWLLYRFNKVGYVHEVTKNTNYTLITLSETLIVGFEKF